MTTLLDQPDTVYTVSEAQDNCETLNNYEFDGWRYAVTSAGICGDGAYVIKAFDETGEYVGTF